MKPTPPTVALFFVAGSIFTIEAAPLAHHSTPAYAMGRLTPPNEESHHTPDEQTPGGPTFAETAVTSRLTTTGVAKVIRSPGWVTFRLP